VYTPQGYTQKQVPKDKRPSNTRYCNILTLGSSILSFLQLVSKKAEKLSFDLWQILKVPIFLGCDL
jgi:hypothetical protein